MLNKIKKDNKGFTIIEVLIVLAIAGLILLVVFLAVPALQRNSRNTQIRSAANNVAGAVNEFVTINGGKLPTTVKVADGTIDVTGATGTTATSGKAPGQFVTADVPFTAGTKCKGTGTEAGSARQFTITFNVETAAKADNPQCIDG